MTAWGDIGRDTPSVPIPYAATIPGALGMGNNDVTRETPPLSRKAQIPSYGQIFPRGQG